MWSYIFKRSLMAVPTIFLVLVLIFALIRLIPGDPAEIMLYELDDAAVIEQMRQKLGLDKPIPVQFFIWLGNLAQGDLGISIRTGEAVGPALLDRFSVTATLVLLAVGIAVVVAVPAGMIAAWKQNSRTDFVIVFLAILKLSLPSFWVGLMLLLFLVATSPPLPQADDVSLASTEESLTGPARAILDKNMAACTGDELEAKI